MGPIWILLLLTLGEICSSLAADHCSLTCKSCDNKVPICVVVPETKQFPCLCKVHTAMCEGLAENIMFHKGMCLHDASSFALKKDLPLYTFIGGTPVNLRHVATKKPQKEKTYVAVLEPSANTAFAHAGSHLPPSMLEYLMPHRLSPEERYVLKMTQPSSAESKHVSLVSQPHGMRPNLLTLMAGNRGRSFGHVIGRRSAHHRHHHHHSEEEEDDEERQKKIQCKLFFESDRNFGQHNQDKHFECPSADPAKIEIL